MNVSEYRVCLCVFLNAKCTHLEICITYVHMHILVNSPTNFPEPQNSSSEGGQEGRRLPARK